MTTATRRISMGRRIPLPDFPAFARKGEWDYAAEPTFRDEAEASWETFASTSLEESFGALALTPSPTPSPSPPRVAASIALHSDFVAAWRRALREPRFAARLARSQGRQFPRISGLLRRCLDLVGEAFALGVTPKMTDSVSTGGSYFLEDICRHSVGVFKPEDEEPYAVNNPKGHTGKVVPGRDTAPGIKNGVNVGEGAAREVAAYLLDHDGFASVPPSVLVSGAHPKFHVADAERGAQPPVKAGSFQLYVPHFASAEDLGPSLFPVDQVHRIGVLDLRMFNTDRNGDNVLVCATFPEDKSLAIDGAGVRKGLVHPGSASVIASSVGISEAGPEEEHTSEASGVEADGVAEAKCAPEKEPLEEGVVGYWTAYAADAQLAVEGIGSGGAEVPLSVIMKARSVSDAYGTSPDADADHALLGASPPESRAWGAGAGIGAGAHPAPASRPVAATTSSAGSRPISVAPSASREQSTGRFGAHGDASAFAKRGSKLLSSSVPTTVGPWASAALASAVHDFVTPPRDACEIRARGRRAFQPTISPLLSRTARASESKQFDPRELRRATSITLVPIDHGLCMPHITCLDEAEFGWLYWRQAKKPFSQETLDYIASLDAEADAEYLRLVLGERLREGCLATLRVCTMLLQRAAAAGLTLFEIGRLMVRTRYGQPSQLERAVAEARGRVAAARRQAGLEGEGGERERYDSLVRLIAPVLDSMIEGVRPVPERAGGAAVSPIRGNASGGSSELPCGSPLYNRSRSTTL